MAIEITMPQLSDTMDNGKILTWLVNEGDEVTTGDALAEVATDKADLEIECFHEGVVAKILAPVGTTVQVGELIAVIAEPGEDASSISVSSAPKTNGAAPAAEASTPAPQAAPAQTPTPAAPSDERVKASPLAKNLAKSQGIDISTLSGSGEGGRIVKKDIENVIKQGTPATSTPAPAAPAPQARPSAPLTPPPAGSSVEPLSTMRQTIADRMVQSKTTIPHFAVTTKINMDKAVEARKSLKTHPQYEGVTFNHLIIKAASLALRNVPIINAAYKDGNLVQPQQVNVGIVTAVEGGLLIPVVKNSDILPLADIVQESNGLVQRARSGRPKGTDLTGGTFSISNVGAFAVESFTAIINPDQGAILAIGSIADEAIVKDGEVDVAKVMRATVSVDHRIIDGVQAAEFLTELKGLLEDPVLLLA